MRKRFKQMPLIIGTLASVTLGTIGFSAWIIDTEVTPTEIPNINVVVGDVNEYEVNVIDAKLDLNQQNIAFESNQEGGIGLQGDGQKEYLDLNFRFTLKSKSVPLFSVTTGEGGTKTHSLTPDFLTGFNIKLTGTGDYTNAGSYIQSPFAIDGTEIIIPNDLSIVMADYEYPNKNPKLTKYAASFQYNDAKTHEIIVSVASSFTWGSAFNYQNPCDINFTPELTREAVAKSLGELKTKLKNCVYTLTIKPTMAQI